MTVCSSHILLKKAPAEKLKEEMSPYFLSTIFLFARPLCIQGDIRRKGQVRVQPADETASYRFFHRSQYEVGDVAGTERFRNGRPASHDRGVPPYAFGGVRHRPVDGTMTIISRHCCWPVSPTTSASARSGPITPPRVPAMCR